MEPVCLSLKKDNNNNRERWDERREAGYQIPPVPGFDVWTHTNTT